MTDYNSQYPQYQQYPQYPQHPQKMPTHVPSLVIGIVAIVTLWFTIGFTGIVLGIIGIVLARRARISHNSKAGFRLSLASLIIGALLLAAAFLGLLAYIGAIGNWYRPDGYI